MSKNRFRVLALLLALSFVLSGCGSAAKIEVSPDGDMSSIFEPSSESFATENMDNYVLAAKNDKFSLYYEEDGLTICIKDNLSGNVLSSCATPDESFSDAWRNFVNSGIVVEYYSGTSTTVSRVNMYNGLCDKKIYLTKNGFTADINFKKIKLMFKINVALNGNSIDVKIPSSSVIEGTTNFKLAAIWVFPFLGYTKSGDTSGYMFIPDGCGALIDLKNNNGKYSQPFKASVYGNDYGIVENTNPAQKFEDEIYTMGDTARISAPIFGICHTDREIGLLGVIESGDYNSEIYAYPNGAITDYNWITNRYVYRQTYLYPTSQTSGITSVQKDRATFDILVHYLLVTGENASYVGLAKEYRNYLTDRGVLNNKSDNKSVKLDFFAGDIEKAVIGTRFVSMTTVNQIDEILKKLSKSNVKKALISYKGWQKNGIYGNITNTMFQNGIGSFGDFENLAKKYTDSSFMLYADLINSYSENDNCLYRYNGKLYSFESGLKLHQQQYKSPNLDEKFLKNFSNGSVGLSVDGVTNEIYSSMVNNKKDLLTRKRFAKNINDSLKTLTNNTVYSSPNAYLWKNTKNFSDFPLYGSDYKFTSKEIPFFSIVLKGSIPLYSEYINFKADSREYLLLMIESGVNPSFLLTYENPSKLIYSDSDSLYTSEFKNYSSMIKEYYEIFEKLNKSVGNSFIDSYEKIGKISKVKYSNGALVYVNFGDEVTEIDGNKIESYSYLIKAGGKS